ncbi:MAG: hypothetical protein IPP63_16835 [Chloracidobacterium sp.]|nr:hypothetical protein [Chloracidobacterium sp.]
MDSRSVKSIIAGVVGTLVMTAVMVVAPMMGMPKMSPPAMLSGMMGMPIIVGWMMHFMIGIAFALAYAFVFAPIVKIGSLALKGAIYRVAAFIFAQIMMAVMGTMFPMPMMEGSMMMIAVGSLMGHVIFGVVVALLVGKPQLMDDLVKSEN